MSSLVWCRMSVRQLALAFCLLLSPMAQAAYFLWETVELPVASGAVCGNGTPYRFFVNRTPFSSNTVVIYEGGGACWDQASCEGVGKLSASNPNGIPSNYMADLNSAFFGLVTPFSARLHPFDRVRTQAWNIVYLPYCTGDVHSGSKFRVYRDRDATRPRVQFHRGFANVKTAAQWLRIQWGRPGELLLTGFSAGGVGSTTTYGVMRQILQPGRSSLLADSGPLFSAPRTSTIAQSPSLPLHEKVRASWGLDEPNSLLTTYHGKPGFDAGDFGSVVHSLALQYPQDRFSYALFQTDANFSAFSYAKFHADIIDAPNEATRQARLNQRWRQDIAHWLPLLNSHGNVGYHIPYWREFNDAHCLTIVEFSGTGIEERGIGSVKATIENALDRHVAPSRAYEYDNVSDHFRIVNPLLYLVEALRRWFG